MALPVSVRRLEGNTPAIPPPHPLRTGPGAHIMVPEEFFRFRPLPPETCLVRKITAGLLGAAAVALSLIALRQPRLASQADTLDGATPAGERVPSQISLDRIRERGF